MKEGVFFLGDVLDPFFFVLKVIYEVFDCALFVFELGVVVILDFFPVDEVGHFVQLIKEDGDIHVDEGKTCLTVDLVVLGKKAIVRICVLITVVIVTKWVFYSYLVGATDIFRSGAALTHF